MNTYLMIGVIVAIILCVAPFFVVLFNGQAIYKGLSQSHMPMPFKHAARLMKDFTALPMVIWVPILLLVALFFIRRYRISLLFFLACAFTFSVSFSIGMIGRRLVMRRA